MVYTTRNGIPKHSGVFLKGMDMENVLERLTGHNVLGYKLFGMPAYLFGGLALIGCIANAANIIPGSMIGSLGLMFIIGVILGEIGDRLPIWKDYVGGGTLLALLGGAVLVHFGLLSTSATTAIGDIMRKTDFITFFAAVLITGSILSIDRDVLLKSFAGYIPTVLAGLAGACAFGALAGALFGKSFNDMLLFYFLPIMGPGTGAGAVPMSQIYESAGLGPAADFLSVAVPILTLALVMSIICGALMNKIGKMFPSLSGNGKLSRAEKDTAVQEGAKTSVSSRVLASGFVMATGFYLFGVICQRFVPKVFGVSFHAFAWMVILLSASSMLNLIPTETRLGARKLQEFFAGQFSWVIMVGVGVVYINIGDVVAVLTFANFVMALSIIVGAVLATMTMGWLVGFFPVESAITAALCMSNSGGAGDVAVLGAAQRMNLLSWAQISSRIGGGIMLILASIIMSLLAGQ